MIPHKSRSSRSLLLTTAVVALMSTFLIGASALAGTADGPAYVANEYIISVASGTTYSAVEQMVDRMGATVVKQLAINNMYLIRLGRSGSSAKKYTVTATLSAVPTTGYTLNHIQPNVMYYPTDVPNDEYWDLLWGMQSINMPAAWDLVKGSSNVIVAVDDTGVADHPDLSDRLLPGYDFVDEDNDPSNDVVGHGTHVSGTIAAQGNNGIGVVGVCWDGVKILPIRVLGPDGGTTDWIVSGLNYAMLNGANVVNMSYGSSIPGMPDEAEHEKMLELADAGIILVASAGNNAADVSAPAMYDETICVGAIGPNDAIAPYSSYGPGNEVDIAAPGGDYTQGVDAMVLSTGVSWSGDPAVPVYGYEYMQGTSMAAPHVSGAAAILLSAGIPSSDVRERLVDSARKPTSGVMNTKKYGAGILDVMGALASGSVRITKPAKGSTVSSNPAFKVSLRSIIDSTVKIYVDYADADDDGIPDNIAAETPIISSSNINSFVNTDRSVVAFNWSDISSEKMSAGVHNVYVSASTSGGDGVSDWGTFTVATKIIPAGIHMISLPYSLDTSITLPSDILLQADTGMPLDFSIMNPYRSVLKRWIPTTQTNATYYPGNVADIAWMNPISGSTKTGGGYLRNDDFRTFQYPAGSGFWLILPYDALVNEEFTAIDASNGFQIYLYKGWNMIGNPYTYAVPWKTTLLTYRGVTKSFMDAVAAKWVQPVLYGYQTEGTPGYYKLAERDWLQPYEGYWIKAIVGGTSNTDSLIMTVLPS